eukprot:4889148-Alexandrium_andersonii.AAC.1
MPQWQLWQSAMGAAGKLWTSASPGPYGYAYVLVASVLYVLKCVTACVRDVVSDAAVQVQPATLSYFRHSPTHPLTEPP